MKILYGFLLIIQQDWRQLTQDEFNELKSIEYQVMTKQFGNYDTIIINVLERQSVPHHLHFHLGTYKNA